MTLANKVTSARFLLCIAYYVILSVLVAGGDAPRAVLLNLAFILFLVVAVSDILDGYLARKYRQVTAFGRIADPLVDKILVCGSFAFFLVLEPLSGIYPAWFVVVVLGREFLVSGIRGAAEAAGIAFGATAWGKQKTLVQNAAVGTGLGTAAYYPDAAWALTLTEVLLWLALAATVVSGAAYILDARKVFRGKGV